MISHDQLAPYPTTGFASASSQSHSASVEPIEPGGHQGVPGIPEVHYHATKRKYLIRNPSGRWLEKTETQFRRQLTLTRVPPSLHDLIIQDTEDYRFVEYAGPLAGRMAGFHEENGKRLLVTSSPQLITPAPGSCSVCQSIMKGLLVNGEPEHGETQWHASMGWLLTSYEALRNQRHLDAPALVIAGPSNAGKSFLQHLITKILGGRSAKCARYMAGSTAFNAELFEAEHLMLEDDIPGLTELSRKKLASAIKEFTVSTKVQSCHRKGETAINLRPFWRLSVTLNDDPDSLQTLPPMDEHVKGKLILLRASKFEMPMPNSTPEERAALDARLDEELPAFLHWLTNEYQIPEQFRDGRFLVRTWQHPDLLEELDWLSAETQFMHLIDVVIPGENTWEGTAEELYDLLLSHCSSKSVARKLLKTPNCTGKLLSKLAKKHPNQFQLRRTEKRREWRILPREA